MAENSDWEALKRWREEWSRPPDREHTERERLRRAEEDARTADAVFEVLDQEDWHFVALGTNALYVAVCAVVFLMYLGWKLTSDPGAFWSDWSQPTELLIATLLLFGALLVIVLAKVERRRLRSKLKKLKPEWNFT
jgi:hypothetical protein